ncbi:MAG: hypothetical protein H6656_04760 [Ardenticatenaceae bacterium]|nr:hypothetical protein [Ardenticatenaceae bacterium]
MFAVLAAPASSTAVSQNAPAASYIVQAVDMETAVAKVTQVGGTITHELGIINAVGADLTPAQFAVLENNKAILLLQENHQVQMSNTASQEVEVRVSSDADDAEESPSGNMYLNSSDLELVYDDYNGGTQLVGMRFRSLAIPQGATITHAKIEFEVDETDYTSTSLVIQAEAVDNAAVFTTADNNISSRPRTIATVNWTNIPAWNQTSEKQQTPDISAVIQEIVSRSGWNNGNDLVLIITGSGTRTAESHDGESSNAPLLTIEYTTGSESAEGSSGGNTVWTVRDEFNAVSYSGNDGTANWNGDWVEFGENDGPSHGRIEVDDSSRCASGYCLEMGGDEVNMYGRGVFRAVNLSGVTSAELTFSYRRSGDEDGSISLQVSSDGSDWTTLETYSMSRSDSQQIAQNFDITPFATANTQIRFVGNRGEVEGYMRIDDVAITYVTEGMIPDVAHTEIVHASSLHDAGYTGEGITVAVMDTGFLADGR